MKNTTLCYLEQDGSWLLLHRNKKKNDPNHDKWIGIGGKFEENESPDDCVRREFREETGLELTEYRYWNPDKENKVQKPTYGTNGYLTHTY